MNKENPQSETPRSNIPYTNCLNCGAELQGNYCHACGQQATSKTPTVGGFVMEYLVNAFLWDSQFLKTFWTLIRKPGQLTKEYLSGKFVSQEHPLKLNMFLLFLFVTLFLFFSGSDKIHNSIDHITKDERVLLVVQFESLMNDSVYIQKIKESPRDTVKILAPLYLVEKYPEVITSYKTIEDTNGESMDKWIAILPHVLIEEQIFIYDEDGFYRFNQENKTGLTDLELVNSIWEEMSTLTNQYFPILALFTAPFLSFSLSLVQRKKKHPRINHFIFSLHYTAFIEFLMICIYILYLTIPMPLRILEYIMIIGSCTYLTIAFRRVYGTLRWINAILKSLLISLIYFLIGLSIFIGIFLVACFVIAV